MKRAFYRAAVAGTFTLLSACATTGELASGLPGLSSGEKWVPNVDPRGLDSHAYGNDLAECEALAEADPDADVAEAQKKGATRYGLLTGGVLVAGSLVMPLAAVAAAGTAAAVGAMNKGEEAEAKYRSTVTSCLRGRGYNVMG